MARVLIVDNDDARRRSISDALRDEGWATLTLPGRPGLPAALGAPFDVILLGCTSPEITAGQFVRKLRVEQINTPLLLISTTDYEHELVDGLNRGADGYLSTPISPLVLRARIRSLLRRRTAEHPHALVVSGEGTDHHALLRLGPMTVNIMTKQVSLEGRCVEFSRREFALLRVLADHPHTPLSRQELLRMAWGDRHATTPNTVEVYIGYLRKRLRLLGADRCIQTRRGQGYQLNAPATSNHNRSSPPNGVDT